MKFRTVLATPWRVVHPSMCWLMVTVFALCVAGAVAICHFSTSRHWWMASTALYCAGIALFWCFQMPHLLLVSIGARQTRTPGVPQAAAWSTVVYAILCIAAPVLALAVLGGSPMAATLLVALTIAGCLAFALLPRYALLLAYVLFLLATGTTHLLHIRTPDHLDRATLAVWTVGALAVLAVADIWRWRTLARGISQTGFRAPMVMQAARQGAFSIGGGAVGAGARTLAQWPTWLQPQVDLRDVDRQHPARAMRVALGSGLMPRTLRSRFRQYVVSVGWLVVVLLYVLGEVPQRAPHSLFSSGWFWMCAGGFTVFVISAGRITAVRQRWSRGRSNLDLLALLPGLGSPGEQKHHVLHVTLWQPLSLLMGALLAGWLVIAVTHASATLAGDVLLAVLGAAAVLAVGVLGALGGKSPGNFALGALLVALLILVGITPGIDSLLRLFTVESASAQASARELFGGIWLLWLGIAGALVVRGWRALQRRPHPFLESAP